MIIFLCKHMDNARLAAHMLNIRENTWRAVSSPNDKFYMLGLHTGCVCIVLSDCEPDPAMISFANIRKFQVVEISLDKLVGVKGR